jgi:AcrR family transcriptional regulator
MINQEALRETIVLAARELFSRYGFKKTTMDDISSSIGKAKSSIYYYFKGKEEIFEAVVESEALMLRNKLTSILKEQKESPELQLHAYVLTRMQSIQQLANFYNALKSEYLNHLRFITKVREKYQREEIRTLESILKSGVERGIFEIPDVYTAAIAILTSMQGLETPLFLGNIEPTSLEPRIKSAMQIILYGIIKR